MVQVEVEVEVKVKDHKIVNINLLKHECGTGKPAESILDEMVKSTGATRLYVWETDTMSGINWCMVPVTIVEMGFMSNPEEDRKMASESYREQLALGIANGIDRYIGSKD